MSAAGPPQGASPPAGERSNATHPPIRMYTTAVCPFCIQAERLLRAKGVAAIEKIRVDLEPGLRQAMMAKTGRRTVPQIYIGDRHIGGYDDLAKLEREGKLERMLAGEGIGAPADIPSVR
jgi:glutaredoxin 3